MTPTVSQFYYTIAVAIGVVIVLILITNIGPKARSNQSIQFDGSETLMMVAHGQRSSGIQEPPRLDEWEIPDENWEEAKYYSGNVKFARGVTQINTPGVYRFKVDLNLMIFNDSVLDLDTNIKLRVIKGAIQHRFEYDLSAILCQTGINLDVPSRSKRETMISCEAIVEILPSDIADGSNSISPQYLISIPPEISNSILDDRQIRFDRNVNDMVATIMLEKLI